MNRVATVLEWIERRDVRVDDLVEGSGLDRKVVQAIIDRRYTTSPAQRERLARALGVTPEAIDWGHAVQVDHMYGHGPQFGRSP